MSKNKNEVSRRFNMFNSCEFLRIHIDKNVFDQLKAKVNAAPKPSSKVAGTIEVDLQELKRLNVRFREDKKTDTGDLVIKLLGKR